MTRTPAKAPATTDEKNTPDIADSMLPKPSGDWPFPTSATAGGEGAAAEAGAADDQPAVAAGAGNDTAEGAASAPDTTPQEHTPTREEAVEMFKARPGLWSVLTTEGTLTRDQC